MLSTLKRTSYFSKWLTPKNLMLGLGLYGYHEYQKYNSKAKACGIVAYVGEKPIATEFALHGIDLLQNRGYDSAGLCSIHDGKFVITKFATDHVKKLDAIDELKKSAPEKHKGAYTCIGHTRWATCGSKTDFNAHPHTDYKDRIALVHNGTIENIEELRQEIKENKIELRSETDTELIVQMIGLYLDKGLPFYDAVKQTLETKLRGTWGLCILNKEEPDRLIVARKGSPIQIGLHQNAIFIASENFAFEKYTENFLKMADGELIYIDLKNKNEFYKNIQERIQIVQPINPETAPRFPFKHFYDQEVMEQPEALMKTLNYGARLAGEKGCTKLGGLDIRRDLLLGIKHIYIIGCGTSYYAGLFVKRIFHLLNSFETIQVIEGSEFSEMEISDKESGVILITQSGQTADVYRALEIAKSKGMPSIGVVNSVGSQIATEVDCGVYLNAGREVSVPSTKTFSCSILALILIGIWFSHNKGEKTKLNVRNDLIMTLHALPTVVGKTLIDVEGPAEKIAALLKDQSDLYLLAKGPAAAIAKEGALKLKEISYIHAESFVSGEIKHGPIALIDSGNPLATKVLLIILNDSTYTDMQHALTEVKANHACTIVITDCPEKLPKSKNDISIVDHLIVIPSLGILTPFLAVLPLQKIGYKLALLRNLNPDKPRNLAKTVTVH